MCLTVRCIVLLVLSTLLWSPLASSFRWENEDTVIIEAAPENDLDNDRDSRQFPFQFPKWPFPSIPARPGPAGGASCYAAASGEVGECVTLKQCYPILYSIDDDNNSTSHIIQNPTLAEMLRNASGTCDTTNQFRFRADVDLRQHFICCSQHKRPPFGSLRPKPPVTGIKLPTTTKRTLVSVPTQVPKVPPTGRPPIPKPPRVDPPSSCGISKVVGGSISGKGRHPWIVALTNNGRQFCGGSLISKNFVLTAAHCISHMRAADVSRIRVHLGEHTLGIGENTEQFEKVTRVLYHRGFTHQTLHNDIALLRLESPARESQYIQPVCLSQDTRNLKDASATLAGWGQVSETGGQSQTLREVAIQIWSNEACASKYQGKSPAGIISSMICAGSPGRDACRGDSGGPLTINTGNVYEQIGLVSWGIGCGSYPGVYTRVASFLPWIEKNRQI